MDGMNEYKIAEVESCIDYKSFRNFFCFSLHKTKFYKIIPIFIYAISFLGSIRCILSLIFNGFDRSYVALASVYITLGIITITIMIYMPRKCWKNNFKIANTKIKYIFFEDKLLVENNNDSMNGTSKIKYEFLHKVYEFNDVLYIFITKSQALVVQKIAFSDDEIKECRSKLKSILNKNYYEYYRVPSSNLK